MIIGHRGASAVAPENTLAAFERAFDDGADGIELDVRLARDGVPVVIHDATLRRTGSTRGIVEEMTSSELREVEVGTWFNRANPKRARAKYAEEQVPTLEMVFDLCRQRQGRIYVELKTVQSASSEHLIVSVSELIRKFRYQRRVIIVSFDHRSLVAAKSLAPSLCTGALFAPRRGVTGWRTETILAAASACGAGEILLHRLVARNHLVEKCIQRGFPVVVWTVDDPKWISRAQALGIHALISNNPVKLLAIS